MRGAYSNASEPFFKYLFHVIKFFLYPLFHPVILVILLALLFLCAKKLSNKESISYASVFIVTYLIVISALSSGLIFYRYVIPMAPVLFYLISMICFNVRKYFPRLVWAIYAIFIIYYSPQLYLFSYELTHETMDVNKAIVSYLNKNASKSDSVFANYEAAPIIYYTGLKTAGGGPLYNLMPDSLHQTGIAPVTDPEWIILRKDWHDFDNGITRILSSGKYTELTLPAIDTEWGNRPCPGFHFFETPKEGERLKIYRKK